MSAIETKGHSGTDFERLRDAVQAAIAAPSAPPTPNGPTVADRIQQLASLREQGLISDVEYEAKRTDLLGQL